MRRGKQQRRRRGNSLTFTSSPGNDALASGIRLEGMWVERMSRGRNTEAGAFFFFFPPMRATVGIRASQIRGVILTGFDVLCHVSVMMADVCLCMFACHIFLPSFFFFLPP